MKIIRKNRDFSQFLKAIKREGKPSYLPFYEHVASWGFISTQLGTNIRQAKGRDYWKLYVDFWLSMGFDCIPMEIPFNLGPVPKSSGHSGVSSQEADARRRIFTLEDYEKFKWPDVSKPIDFEPFESVAGFLPEGVKIVAGVSMGPFENATQELLGLTGFCFMMEDHPEVVEGIFEKLNALYMSANTQLASMDAVGACRQGDDLGFKTSTFLPPDILRKYVFPVYKNMVSAAHKKGKPFILHSCGNLKDVYEDLIGCGIDAKHSFEDIILPVAEFKKQYGSRITPVGGLDVDFICRNDEKHLREYTRKAVEQCFYDGHWALGTGNSLPDYMPVQNYLTVLDEAIKVTGS